LVSADSDITVAASGDYSSYLREYSNSEFNGSYSSYSNGGCCGYSCGYSSSNSGSKHTYSENEHVVDVSESYESLLNESRHSDGGAFYRVSFDGSASGVGSSSDVSHSYNITETDSAWSSSCGNYVSGGSSDYENGSGGDSNKWADYNYSASWSWDNEGDKSASISNQVSGHHDSSSYSYKDNYWEGYGCGCDYSCTDGYSNSTSYTHLDYNDSLQHTGWSSKGGKTASPFSVKWSPFYGSYNDDSSSCCYYSGGCCGYDYSYQGYSFSAPNFSVSMSESTYNGEVSESNDVWHSGRSTYYYYYSGYSYLYSQTAPDSHIPTGSNPSAISGAGQTTHVTIPIIEVGNPSFNNYAYVNVSSILDAAFPEPEITQPVSTPNAAISFLGLFAGIIPSNINATDLAKGAIKTLCPGIAWGEKIANEVSTVYNNMREADRSILMSVYTAGGTSVARFVGVENLSYAFDGTDPVSGVQYGAWARVGYTALGAVELVLTATGFEAAGKGLLQETKIFGKTVTTEAKNVSTTVESSIRNLGDDILEQTKTRRGKNHIQPDSSATGPHTVFQRDVDGAVKKYVEYTPNSQNPNGFDQVKRVDTQYSNPHSHGGIPVPHVHLPEGKIRPARPNELPK
jgi:hypothetical protein